MDKTAYLTIFGMAAVTYFSRIAGLWCLNRMKLTPRMEEALNALPGTILISIVAPLIVEGTLSEKIAALITALIAWRSKNLLLAMISGIFSVWLLRHFCS